MKKLIKLLVVLLLLVILLVLFGPMIGGGFIKSKIETQLAESLEGKATIDELSVSWFSGVRAKGIHLEQDSPPRMVIDVRSLEAQPEIGALLGGKIVIPDLRADGVEVRMIAGGGDDRADDKPKGEPAELPELDVKAEVTDISVTYEGEGFRTPSKINSVRRLTAHARTGSPVRFTLDDGDLSIAGEAEIFDDRKIRDVERMTATADVTAKQLGLQRYEEAVAPWADRLGGVLDMNEKIEWKGGDIVLTGSMGVRDLVFDEGSGKSAIATLKLENELRLESTALPRGQMKLDIQGDLGGLAKLFQGLPDVSGALTGSATVETDDAGVTRVRGSTRILDFAAKNLPGGVAPVREKEVVLRHDFDMDQGRVKIEHLDVTASFVKLAASGQLDMGEGGAAPSGLIRLNGRADLTTLCALLGEYLPMRFSGDVSLNGEAEGKPDGTHIAADFSVPDLKATGGALGDDVVDLGKTDFRTVATLASDRSAVEVSDMSLTSSGAVLKASGSLGLDENAPPRPLDVDVRADLAKISALVPGGLPVAIVGNAAAKGKITMGQRLSIDLNLSGERVAAAPTGTRPNPADGLTFTGQLKAVRDGEQSPLSFPTLTVNSRDLQLDAGGTTVAEDRTTVRLNAARGNLARIAALMRPWMNIELAGTADVKGTIEKGATLAVDVSGSADRLRASGEMLSGSAFDANRVDFALKGRFGDAMQLDAFSVKAPRATLRQPDGASLGGDMNLTGSLGADGQFDVKGRGANLVSRDATGVEQRMNSELLFEAAGRQQGETYDITRARLTGDGIQAAGTGSMGPDRMRLDTVADLDLDGFARSWLGLFAENPRGKGKGKLKIVADIPRTGDAPMTRATGDAQMTADELTMSGVTVRNLQLAGNLAGGLGRITRGDATVNGGTAKLTGQIDYRAAEPQFQGRLDVKRFEIVEELQPAVARIIPIFAGLGAKVSAFIDLEADVSGTGADWETIKPRLNGLGNVNCDEGKVVGGAILTGLLNIVGVDPNLNFDSITSKFEVKDGAVHQDNMMILGQTLDLRLGGKTSLDGDLDYTIGVKPKGARSAKFQRFAKVLDPEGFLPLGLGGTISSPSIQPPDPSKLVGNAVDGILKKGLGDALGDKKDGDPLKGLGDLIGGKKDGKDGEKKDPLGGLGGLLGGNKKKDGDAKKQDGNKDPLGGLGGLLGGNKKKDDGKKKDEEKKPSPLGGLGGLLGGGKKKDKDDN